jgi:hypothetical protein
MRISGIFGLKEPPSWKKTGERVLRGLLDVFVLIQMKCYKFPEG